jgi:hypothetical protein
MNAFFSRPPSSRLSSPPYLADHLNIHASFPDRVAPSITLVVGYLRMIGGCAPLPGGRRGAAALPGACSLRFFPEDTGLTVTVGAV